MEAALERVRGKAQGMQESKDLWEVSKALSEEFKLIFRLFQKANPRFDDQRCNIVNLFHELMSRMFTYEIYIFRK